MRPLLFFAVVSSQLLFAGTPAHLLGLTAFAPGVVGGRIIRPTEVPSAVRLDIRVRVKDEKGVEHTGDSTCSGFQIGDCVLTAKHCQKYSTVADFKVTDTATGKSVGASELLSNPDEDLLLVKMKDPLPATRAGRDSLCKSVPTAAEEGVIVGFGDHEEEQNDGKKRIGRMVFHENYSGAQTLEAFALPSRSEGGDSGAPFLYLEDGKPCVGAVHYETTESLPSTDEEKALEKTQDETRYVPGNRRSQATYVARSRKWIDEGLDKLGCTPKNQKTLTPAEAMAGAFSPKPSERFPEEKLKNEDTERLRKVITEELLGDIVKTAERTSKALKEILGLKELPKLYRPSKLSGDKGTFLNVINGKSETVAAIWIGKDFLRIVKAPASGKKK